MPLSSTGSPTASRKRAIASARARIRMKLETVVAHVLDPVDAHELARVEPGAAAQARDERVALDQPPELPSRLVRDDGELGARRDRRERAVHVEDKRRTFGRLGERREQVVTGHRPRIRACRPGLF